MDLFSAAGYSKRMKTRTLLLALCASALTPHSGSLAEDVAIPAKAKKSALHFPVKSDGKWGIVNTKGEFVIPAEYDSAEVWDGGMVRLRKDGLDGVVGLDGTPIIPMTFRYIENFGDRDFTYATTAEGKVIIDRTGKVILGPGFQSIYSFDGERSFIVQNGRLVGVVTLDCDWLLEPDFDQVRSVEDNGLALAVTSNKEHGYVDAQGKWVIAPEDHNFEDLWDFDKNGLAGAKAGGKWGHIDARGDWVIEPFATGPLPPLFYNDPPRAYANINGKYGLIDTQGQFVVPAEYDRPGGGGDGVYVFARDGKAGAFDHKGKIIIPFEYDEIGWLIGGDTVRATKDGREVLLDRTGKEVSEAAPIWTSWSIERGWRAAEKEGKWGAIDEKGAWVLEPKFECVSFCFTDAVAPPVATRADPLGPRFTSADIDSPREQAWCRVDD